MQKKKMLEGKEILSIFHQFDATSVKIKKKYLKSEGGNRKVLYIRSTKFNNT